jgi:hydrogenase expression/formation protein HypE
VGGAQPLWLSAAFIIEEGFTVERLWRIVASMRPAADAAGIAIVTGDTKVVGRGNADKLFITTAGIGVIPPGLDLSARAIQPGDHILVNGRLGEYGAAILAAPRGEIELESDIGATASRSIRWSRPCSTRHPPRGLCGMRHAAASRPC